LLSSTNPGGLAVVTAHASLRAMRSLLLACLLLSSALLLRAEPASNDDAAAIHAARLAQNAAIVAHDLDRIASFWTDNVIIQRGLGLQAIGKDAYLQLFRDDGPSPAFLYQRIPEAIEVSPDWPLAFESGHWEGSLNGRVLISGKYSAQWVLRDGHWFIRGEVFVALTGHDEGKQQKAIP
jgi:ketosteroid isomerase-like protein